MAKRFSFVALLLSSLALQPATGGAQPTAQSQDAPRFRSGIRPVTPQQLRDSWREGCPVDPSKLRAVTVSHWDFQREVRTGKLIARAGSARDIVRVMRALYQARFPFRRMRPVDRYGGSDDASMDANNTSAFNCRKATGSGSWSRHAFGTAIDINPVQNPYVGSDGTVLPPRGERYTDRSKRHRGMIRSGDVVVSAFADIGWEWGGHFSSIKDYQHFSKNGR